MDTTTSPEDIKALRTSDPFMFYSIPSVRKAVMRLDDVDRSSANAHVCCNSQEVTSTKRARVTISRHTAISYEAHPSLALEELIDELDGEQRDEVWNVGDDEV